MKPEQNSTAISTLSTLSSLSTLPNCIRKGDIVLFEGDNISLSIRENEDGDILIIPHEEAYTLIQDIFSEGYTPEITSLVFDRRKFEEVLGDDLDLIEEVYELTLRFQVSENGLLELLAILRERYQITYILRELAALPHNSMKWILESDNPIRSFQKLTQDDNYEEVSCD